MDGLGEPPWWSVVTGSSPFSLPPNDYLCTSQILILTPLTTNVEAMSIWRLSTEHCPPRHLTEAGSKRTKETTMMTKRKTTPAEEAGSCRDLDLGEDTTLVYEEGQGGFRV